ncbi:hypothetical protein SAMN05446589_1480 [Streptomyces sp. OV198]|jgi:hypothetical protein|uniref:DUF6479 family protein n=1 Tax=Streptomyces sp. OV198 TaxID=1882787 RepID=UPI000BDBC6E7|nr:hypothetical protein SAMN05446589_1480 [Streptomyces sp. OV198]
MMTTRSAIHYVAVSDAAIGTIGAFVGGLVVAGVLMWAVSLGVKIRRREPRRPRPDEQPREPESGPVREVREVREPDEVPKAADESERLRPHNLHASGSKRGENQDVPRWVRGSSGSVGGGGPGRA